MYNLYGTLRTIILSSVLVFTISTMFEALNLAHEEKSIVGSSHTEENTKPKFSLAHEVIFEILRSKNQSALPETESAIQFIQGMKSDPSYVSSLIVSDPRLLATFYLAKNALDYPGDFVETGVYKGCTAAIMMKILMTLDDKGRKFYACDSFGGLPDPVDLDGDRSFGNRGSKGDFAFGLNDFLGNLKQWKTYDEKRIVVVKGFFNETLPHIAVEHISFLRLDGDLFISTHDALINLYDKVVPGGFIYVDDFGSFTGCRAAVNKFRSRNRIFEPIHYIREDEDTGKILFEAIWWQKKKNKENK